MTIETKFDSNYRKVLVAARRARQLQNGSAALIPDAFDARLASIAQDEIEAGKIAYVKNDVPVTKPLVEDRGIPILSQLNCP